MTDTQRLSESIDKAIAAYLKRGGGGRLIKLSKAKVVVMHHLEKLTDQIHEDIKYRQQKGSQ